MCLSPSLPQDNSARIARQQEQQREARIDKGKNRIDAAFKGFTPDYYKGVQNDYEGYYNPQVDKQFSNTRQDLRYNLARGGIQDSSAANTAFGKLVDSYNDQRRAVADRALEASNNIRSQVEGEKNQLYSQNTASADPSLAAISAAGAAGSLQSPPAFSPLADLFSGAANAGAAYLYGNNKSLPSGYGNAFRTGLPGNSSGYVAG